MALGHLEKDQEGQFGKQNRSKKSRATVPLRQTSLIFPDK